MPATNLHSIAPICWRCHTTRKSGRVSIQRCTTAVSRPALAKTETFGLPRRGVDESAASNASRQGAERHAVPVPGVPPAVAWRYADDRSTRCWITYQLDKHIHTTYPACTIAIIRIGLIHAYCEALPDMGSVRLAHPIVMPTASIPSYSTPTTDPSRLLPLQNTTR